MLRFSRFLTLAAFVLSVSGYVCHAQYAPDAPAVGLASGAPEEAASPGGDAARWLIGAEYGGTYASFGPGAISFYTYNPALASRIESTVQRGSGYGFYGAAAVEWPQSEYYGYVGKLHYQSRGAEYLHTTENVRMPVAGSTEGALAALEDKAALEVTTFGFEILAKVQHPDWPYVYALAGPSVTWVLSDRLTVEQRILSPDNVYYLEAGAVPADKNKLRSVSGAGSGWGFESWFPDLVLGVGGILYSAGSVRLVAEAYYTIPLNGMPNHDEVWRWPPEDHLFPRQNPVIYEGWDNYAPNILNIHAGVRVAL